MSLLRFGGKDPQGNARGVNVDREGRIETEDGYHEFFDDESIDAESSLTSEIVKIPASGFIVTAAFAPSSILPYVVVEFLTETGYLLERRDLGTFFEDEVDQSGVPPAQIGSRFVANLPSRRARFVVENRHTSSRRVRSLTIAPFHALSGALRVPIQTGGIPAGEERLSDYFMLDAEALEVTFESDFIGRDIQIDFMFYNDLGEKVSTISSNHGSNSINLELQGMGGADNNHAKFEITTVPTNICRAKVYNISDSGSRTFYGLTIKPKTQIATKQKVLYRQRITVDANSTLFFSRPDLTNCAIFYVIIESDTVTDFNFQYRFIAGRKEGGGGYVYGNEYISLNGSYRFVSEWIEARGLSVECRLQNLSSSEQEFEVRVIGI